MGNIGRALRLQARRASRSCAERSSESFKLKSVVLTRMVGDTAKALAAYKDFLTLWKDADPDIPILKEAKAEYAKLQ